MPSRPNGARLTILTRGLPTSAPCSIPLRFWTTTPATNWMAEPVAIGSSTSCSAMRSAASTAILRRATGRINWKNSWHLSPRAGSLARACCAAVGGGRFQLPLHPLLKQRQHGCLLGGQGGQRIAQFLFRPSLQRLDQRSIQVRIDNRGVNITLAADCLRVAQSLC